MTLVFASQNDYKTEEIRNILGNNPTILSMCDMNIPDDIPENELTLEGNALVKARHIRKITGMNVFADDTGLEIDALYGMPGVHSARFAGEEKNSSANIDKVLTLLGDRDDRKARFRTVIALIYEDKEYLFEGIVNGSITSERRGENGFGYDPVFLPEGNERTFAEMDLHEKNRISHRVRAIRKLKEFLDQHQLTDNNIIS
jgi:XTP/dITP diphosphohydrolase